MTGHYQDLVSASDWLKQMFSQSEALLRSALCLVISLKFLRSFLRRHFARKPVVASQNVGCFPRLVPPLHARNKDGIGGYSGRMQRIQTTSDRSFSENTIILFKVRSHPRSVIPMLFVGMTPCTLFA